MSIGSPTITVRVGAEIRKQIVESVDRRNNSSSQLKAWTISEFVVQAIIDKLNHDRRSRRNSKTIRQLKCDDNGPRQVWEEKKREQRRVDQGGADGNHHEQTTIAHD